MNLSRGVRDLDNKTIASFLIQKKTIISIDPAKLHVIKFTMNTMQLTCQ